MQDTKFHGITISLQEHWANIDTDKKLMDFLSQPGNGSVELAEYILKRYRELFQKPLDISEASLAVEILVHSYIDVLSQNTAAIQKLLPEHIAGPILHFANAVHERTAVINCGERAVDSNRFVFDGLAPFHSLIFSALGKLA